MPYNVSLKCHLVEEWRGEDIQSGTAAILKLLATVLKCQKNKHKKS